MLLWVSVAAGSACVGVASDSEEEQPSHVELSLNVNAEASARASGAVLNLTLSNLSSSRAACFDEMPTGEGNFGFITLYDSDGATLPYVGADLPRRLGGPPRAYFIRPQASYSEAMSLGRDYNFARAACIEVHIEYADCRTLDHGRAAEADRVSAPGGPGKFTARGAWTVDSSGAPNRLSADSCPQSAGGSILQGG
jgi:hypothetical protein